MRDQEGHEVASPSGLRMMKTSLTVGLIGCGNISPAYFTGTKPYPWIRIAACADLDRERARVRAGEFGVERVLGVEELLADPSLDLVLNLTVPRAHAQVNLAALKAGKHVYCEKPFGVDRTEGRQVLATASRKKLRVGCAPDTFLGGGIQTARRLLDQGAIGEPVAATANMCGHGHESWHPNPEFFYEQGGGPMFDMGPYYLTALVTLLGPVRRVTGATRISFPQRTITSQPHAGKVITVETPTHFAGALDFVNGTIATITMSFDVWAHHLPIIEVYGSEGSLQVPDPNGFGGVVRVCRAGQQEWTEVPLSHRSDVARGIGLADLARGILTGRPHRATAELGFHVLDIMQAVDEASTRGRHVQLRSTCERPPALPPGLALGELD